ncbi:AbrB family transcriptional regulator [Pseudofrankia inefficax]|uniref:Membrane protein AbrB duplication n=1 Tax=Pseudofrankia inefficax (strain DSM 45817 / CECT 9037 / DDB 130130 / EuI1c) TaxID=298654 RepID=E3J5B0_PSEI1|nr:AbrB family transcriptional regulator [Pseudofrankia inefficax]ADP80708.1 membrane protein AbrB duplication [Pseudofrankia inefficax]
MIRTDIATDPGRTFIIIGSNLTETTVGVSAPGPAGCSTGKSRIFSSATGRARARSALGWIALIAICFLLSDLGEHVGIPAAQLLVSMLVGAALALAGVVRRRLPARANRASQVVVGVLMGSYLAPSALSAATGRALPLIGVTLASIAICVAVAGALTRRTRATGVDTTLGLMPGGSAAIVAYATELGADSRFVAFAQYLRVGVVAASTPLIVAALGRNPGSSHSGRSLSFSHLVASPHQVAGLAMLTATGLLGVGLARRLRLPAPALLGPMFLTAAILWTDLTGGFSPAGSLRDIAFVLVGLEVGLRFDLASVRYLGRMLGYLLGASVAVCLACAGLAWALSALVGMSFTDSYLATTPGGINAILATAASAHADLPVIAAVQSVRLLLVIALTAPIIRAATRWRAFRSQRSAALG